MLNLIFYLLMSLGITSFGGFSTNLGGSAKSGSDEATEQRGWTNGGPGDIETCSGGNDTYC